MKTTGDLKILAFIAQAEICRQLDKILAADGSQIRFAGTGENSIDLIGQYEPDVVLLHEEWPDALKLVNVIPRRGAATVIVGITASGNPAAADPGREAVFYDTLKLPLDEKEVTIMLRHTRRFSCLLRRITSLEQAMAGTPETGVLLGDSEDMLKLAGQVRVAGQHQVNVLLGGDRGTGKLLVAQIIHGQSVQSQGPCVVCDCTMVSADQLDKELFGSEPLKSAEGRGTPAGCWQLARHGTLILKEVGCLPLSIQGRLLRLLSGREPEAGLGADGTAQVRLLATTTCELKAKIATGDFREDLYYRLAEFTLTLPPLRQRAGDVTLLARFFLDQYNREFQKSVKGITPEAERCLLAHDWPGNVRELQHALKRAVILAEEWIRPEHWPAAVAAQGQSSAGDIWIQARADEQRPIREVSREVVAQLEREMIQRTLHKSGGNKMQTARWLGIDYKTLFNKLRQYQIRSERHAQRLPIADMLAPGAGTTMAPASGGKSSRKTEGRA
ncbi:sigma-54-dependent Fis family transcriptional regulator [candidate division FCPU426 bacterium]|nr:sigma-54-dependent Fis family transcriptional regulator [candidate division FCPU426 bacterium]